MQYTILVLNTPIIELYLLLPQRKYQVLQCLLWLAPGEGRVVEEDQEVAMGYSAQDLHQELP